MASPKKTTKSVAKSSTAKKAPVASRSKTTVRTATVKKAPAKKIATKAPVKTAAPRPVARPAVSARKPRAEEPSFFSFNKVQSVFWLIFCMAVLATGAYILGRNDEAHYTQDKVDEQVQKMIDMKMPTKKHQ